jgi:CubicO group peptidase (beta-lactamase class C family)
MNQIQRWASVTKTVTAWAVLIAHEEGSLDLDAPVGPPGSTVRLLLSHAAGVAVDEPTAKCPPATKRIYSNAGFDLLAAALAEATDMSWQDYVHAAVIEPLAMSSTTLGDSAAHGASGSTTDLMKLAAEFAHPQLLAQPTRCDAFAVQFGGLDGVLPGFGRQTPNDWGLGLELRGSKVPHWTSPRWSPQSFGHFGRSGSFVIVDPTIDLAVVSLCGNDFGPWATTCWPALLDDIHQAATTPTNAPTTDQPAGP